jgi:DNA-binding winged helix-turn-helix (wHTH) protein
MPGVPEPGYARFRFDEFVLSPRRRVLLRNGQPIALIPRYFDLLVLLVERRNDAVSKQVIFAQIWSDVVVSDGALAQAVRTLRRTLGDDSREPRFIRTVSRHGYQFVHPAVVEEPDATPAPALTSAPGGLDAGGIGPLVDRLIAGAENPQHLDDARDAAEQLHALGTAEALAQLNSRKHGAGAVAILRDARWNVPGAGSVPLDARAAQALIRLRMVEAGRVVMRRWARAAGAGVVGGGVAGAIGGLLLYAAPMSTASPAAPLALGALGALAGGLGAAGIGAGLAAAEVLVRSRRGLALVLGGAVAGAFVAAIGHAVLRSLLDGLIGVNDIPGNGVFEGLVIGGCVGLGYAVATRQPPGGGLAAPIGGERITAALIVGLFTGLGAAALALSGGVLVGGLVNEIARSSPDARLALAPIGRLIGEPDFGLLTRTVLSAFEGGVFGFSLAIGLTSRPRTSR